MRTIRRILVAVICLLLVAAVVAFVIVNRVARKGLPDYATDVRLEGMKDEVVVYRDAYAVPHIFAKNEEDLCRATGYVMAQDRLWQMDLIRRGTAGRLSEIFGRGLIDTDVQMRMIRIPEKSRRVLRRTEPEILRALEAFSDGVNQYIAAHKKRLPPEFSLLGYVPEPWVPEHSLNLIGYMAWMGSNLTAAENLLYRAGRVLGPDSEKFRLLLPDNFKDITVIHPGFEAGGSGPVPGPWLTAESQALADLGLALSPASNNWAVDGRHSASGKPLVANDMHLAYSLPGIWYQLHQVVEGVLDVTGVTLPGAPLIVAGHNDRIAWGFTFAHHDAMDFYRETVDPRHPDQYLYKGAWLPIRIRRESIRLKKGPPVEKVIRYTHRGPIVSDVRDFARGEVVSMRWLGLDDTNELRAVYHLDRARNWDEFREAVKDFQAVGVNIVYGDVDGHIGMYTCAGIPVREGGGLLVRPGDTDEFNWKGIIPFDELPHTFDPPEGMVSSANNKPADDAYPYPIGSYFAIHRIDRIREMLAEKPAFGSDDFRRMQADLKLTRAEKTLPAFLAVLKSMSSLSPLELKARDILQSWNFEARADGPATLLFEKLFIQAARNIFEDELGPELAKEMLGAYILPLYLLEQIRSRPESPWCDDIRTEDVRETLADIVVKSFREVVGTLEKEMGPDPAGWIWGRVHTLTLSHPMSQVRILDRIFRLNRGPYAAAGSTETVCPATFIFDQGFQVFQGASHRHIFDAADWDRSLTVLPGGQSGIPASLHYADQVPLFLENRYHSDFVSRSKIEKEARYTMRITS